MSTEFKLYHEIPLDVADCRTRNGINRLESEDNKVVIYNILNNQRKSLKCFNPSCLFATRHGEMCDEAYCMFPITIATLQSRKS